MPLIVQKYGGSSVADSDRLRMVARRIAATRDAGHDVAIVVSAMGDTTDELLQLARGVSSEPVARELDMLLTAGERISTSLLAMALHELGHEAASFTGVQAGLRTDQAFGDARILDVQPARIADAIAAGVIPIVAGFQGGNADEDVTTLGRGGSDTTAVALAAALGAEVCEIRTDVDGLYTADPRVVPHAQRLPYLSTEEALELTAHGAKVLHRRSVEIARRHGVSLHVRSSFGDTEGTWISDDPVATALAADPLTSDPHASVHQHADLEESPVEQPIISGVTHTDDQSMLTVVGVPDVPGTAAAIFAVITGAVATVDMVGQTHTAADTGLIDFSFALPMEDATRAAKALQREQDRLGFATLTLTDDVGKVSVVGDGMRSTPQVSAQLFEALSAEGITVHLIAQSEIRLSVVVPLEQLEHATRVLHGAFGLDAVELAIVHGGAAA
ncbi:aspartate kinase [Agrococcus sp. KRD186]|uniref:aspartate kinase n=1 Tax=Agrococcus sp. KRD186 TaxID=2729730 RepID=UPI0019D0AD39|nr:aspartate kinase [Agrococcus sp. KRD186]